MTYQPGWHFLQVPGPSNVPHRILRAIDMPTIDHRGPDFAAMTFDVIAGLKRVFQTTGDVVIYAASGSGAWEAAIRNTLGRRRQGPHVRDRPVLGALVGHREAQRPRRRIPAR